jgi:hypothetical protein
LNDNRGSEQYKVHEFVNGVAIAALSVRAGEAVEDG